MAVLPGYNHEGSKGVLCESKKALHSFELSPRKRFWGFTKTVKKLRMQINCNHSLIIKHGVQG